MTRENVAAEVALFDLDGVVRDFPKGADWPGLAAVAFSPGLLDQAVTGKITDEEWRAEVQRRLGKESAEVVAAWSASRGKIDHSVLSLVRAVRVRAPVGLLTNGTTRLVSDLEHLGLVDEFDVVFNSAELGVAKPDPAIYELVCDLLGVTPGSVFFVDDSPSHVDGARSAGLAAWLFVDASLLADALHAVGLLDRSRNAR